MKSKETRIPQFYDILDQENAAVRYIYEDLLKKATDVGFLEVETSSIELKQRYLDATGVHFSKIFEVRRPKQGNTFALQADLAMSMSRFVADLPTIVPTIKMIQLGKMYRDRIYTIPGYRREFKQILLGEWGTESLFADAEIIFLAYNALKDVPNSKISYIEVSNANIFNSIIEGMAEKIRFNGIKTLNSVEQLNEKDKSILIEEFNKGCISFSELESVEEKLQSRRVNDIYNIEKELFKNTDTAARGNQIYIIGRK